MKDRTECQGESDITDKRVRPSIVYLCDDDVGGIADVQHHAEHVCGIELPKQQWDGVRLGGDRVMQDDGRQSHCGSR